MTIAIYLLMVKKLLILKPRILKFYHIRYVQEAFQKTFFPANTHKTGLSGYIYDFSVDYWAIANDKMLDNYLMKKNNII